MPRNNAQVYAPLSEAGLREAPLPAGVPPSRNPPDFRSGSGLPLPTVAEGADVKVDYWDVEGDGNCFFRGISVYFTGDEGYYEQYRAVRDPILVVRYTSHIGSYHYNTKIVLF